MNKIKKVLLVVVVFSIIFNLCGCSIFSESKYDKMLAYLHEKYDDTFTFYAPFGGEIGAKSVEMTAKSEKYPDDEVWVLYYKDENGEEVYSDDYLDVKYKKQTEQLFTDIISEVFQCPIILDYRIGSTGTHNKFKPSVSFEEYITVHLFFGATISNEYIFEDKDMITDLLEEYFLKYNLDVSGMIYFADSSDTFKNWLKLSYAEDERLVWLEFELGDDGKYEFEWHNI